MRNLGRLINAWFSGTYNVFPWRTLFVFILVGIYAINPFDIIPDFIPIVGVVDDAAMLAFLFRSLRKDVEKFLEWERTQTSTQHTTDVVDAVFEEVKDLRAQAKGRLKQ